MVQKHTDPSKDVPFKDTPNAAQFQEAKERYLKRMDSVSKTWAITAFLGSITGMVSGFTMMKIGALVASGGAVLPVVGLVALTLTLVGTGIYLNYKANRTQQSTGFDQCEVSATRTAEHLMDAANKIRNQNPQYQADQAAEKPSEPQQPNEQSPSTKVSKIEVQSEEVVKPKSEEKPRRTDQKDQAWADAILPAAEAPQAAAAR